MARASEPDPVHGPTHLRPIAHKHFPHSLRNRRVDGDLGEKGPLLGSLVEAQRDPRVRLPRGEARPGDRVQNPAPRVLRLEEVQTLGRVGLGDSDRPGGGGSVPGGFAGRAVVRDGGRRHGVLPGESGGGAGEVRPPADGVRRGALGERGAGRDACVRHGVWGRGFRDQLPISGASLHRDGRLP